MCNARKGWFNMEKRKFNLVDAIVILVVIAAIAFVGYKFVGGAGGSGASTYEVKFLCEEVPVYAASVIEIGDKVLDEQKETNLGVVTDVKISESRTYTTTDEGVVKVSDKPYYKCVEITAIAEAQDYDFGMIVNSSKYGVGHSITIRVGKAKVFGRISGIEKLEDGSVNVLLEDVTEAE